MQRNGWVFSLLLFTIGIRAQVPPLPCAQDKIKSVARSQELAAIVKADQDDRIDWATKPSEAMIEVMKRDEVRRKRVGEIFGEGCFTEAADYAAAALVFQHGDAPDHFFQTYIWARRAVELGDPKQKSLMAWGLDRYLVSISHKQLFGSQGTRPTPEACWCVQPVEGSFPAKKRKEFTGKSLADYYEGLKQLNHGKHCPRPECATQLKPTPRGTIPGFW